MAGGKEEAAGSGWILFTQGGSRGEKIHRNALAILQIGAMLRLIAVGGGKVKEQSGIVRSEKKTGLFTVFS